MKKEIITIDEKSKILRITTLGERWYAKPFINQETGLPEYKFYPSSTWISDYYPKGIGFYKNLANKGWDLAEEEMQAAGDKGSKVHYACQDIDSGKGVNIQTSKYLNHSTEKEEELTPEEIECILAFQSWTDVFKPELLASELTAFNDNYGYAGTIDKIYRLEGRIYIVDLKTGQNIWPSTELQISSYSNLEIDYKALGIKDEEWQARKLAILQIGYYRNERKYKFTEMEDKFGLFLHAKAIWNNENLEAKPKEAKFPLVIKSQFRANGIVEEPKPKKKIKKA